MRWISFLARFFLLCCSVVYFPQSFAAQGSQLATFSGTNGVEAQILDNGGINYCTGCHSVAGGQTPYMETYANMTATPAMFYPGCTAGGTTVAACANVRGNDESMPFGGPALSTTHKNLLSEWIADGTLNSSTSSYIDNTAATSVGKYGATFNAEVNENGVSTTFEFEYGVGTAFNLEIGSLTGSGTGGGGATYGTESISQAVTGLTCGTNYQYRAQETSDDNYQDTTATSFTTSTCPTVTTIPDDTITEDENFSYDVGNTNVTTETVTYSLDATSLSRGMTINSSTGLISWSAANVPDAPEVNTNYSVTVTASYTVSGGTAPDDSDTFTITVTPVNDAPVFSTAGTTTATEDTLYSYDANYTDTESDTVTFSLQTAPSGMSINSSTGVVSWTPTNAQAQPGVNVHAVTIRATDNGTVNGSPSTQFTDQSFNITVSNTNDAPSFTSSPTTTATEDTLYTYDADASDPEGNTLTYSLFDAPSGMSINASTGVVSWTPTNAQALAGSHSVTVRVTDNGAPNLATDQSFSITVSNTNDAPTFDNAGTTSATEDSLYSYDANATDIDGDTLTYSLTTSPSGMSINSSTGVVSWTPTNAQAQSGSNVHDVTVRIFDGTVNVDQSYQITVSNANDAPSFTSSPTTTATEDTLYSYDADASDIDNGDTLTFSLTAAPSGMSINSATGVVSWTPSNAQALAGNDTHNVTVRVNDGSVDVDQSFSITVTNTNDTPSVTSNAPTTCIEDLACDFSPGVSDIDGDTLFTWALINPPSGMSINASTGAITWTPTNGQTTSGLVTVTATDAGLLTGSANFTIAVDGINDPPQITSSAITTATEDTLYTYAVGVTDPDDSNNGTDLTWSLLSAPAGMSISNVGVISWTPTEGVLTSGTVTVQVADGGQNGASPDTQSFTITVTAVDDAPSITSSAVTIATEDTLYSYDVDATDPENASLTYSLTSAPAGMTINASSGVIAWTPTEGVSSSGTVTVSVSDGGLSNTQSFTITVTAVNDAPVISSSSITTATQGVVYSYDVNATDAESGTLTFALTTSPAGMAINASTGVITWIPTNAQSLPGSDTHNVTVLVSDNGTPMLSDSQSFVISVTNVNDTPTVTSNAPSSCTEDVACNFVPTANDIDGETVFVWSLTNAPTGMTINAATGAITWTPVNGQTSTGTVTVNARDAGNLTGLTNFSFNVTAVNDAPLITSTAVTTATEDSLYTYTVIASDVDDSNNGSNLQWSLSGQPAGMTISTTGVITWTPTNGVTSAGPITVTVADGGEDGASAATQTYSITVGSVNDSPTVSPISAQSVTELSNLVVIVGASDPDDANDGSGALQFSLSGAPVGMSVSNIGVISWTPGQDTSGIYNVTVIVTDGGEDGSVPASTAFAITVNKLDVDSDTVADYHDNCPLIVNTDQLNTDGDSEGNVCDLDDDNDLIPDEIEVAMGLDPLDASDATDDLDNDGLSNVDEYLLCQANNDTECATMALDNVPPVITTNGALVINASGYVSFAGESATASDVHDGDVAVTADFRSPFRPGRHIVTWTATDAAGNTATEDQQIDVLPLVTIDANSVTGENRAVQLAVRLNGDAPTYPVEIDYTVAGTATSADHDAVSGRVTLNSGDTAYIAFNTLSDGSTESDETVEFTLSAVSANAVLSADLKGTVTIVDRQVAPSVVLQVEQNSLMTQQVFSDAGVVTLRAMASDPNGGNLTYNWSNTSNALGIFASGNTATFDPLSIAAGNYTVAVTVSDGIATVERETVISIAATTLVLSNVTDTDHDGLDDQTEGLADSDGDGVSDYLDPVLARHQLNITNDNETDRFYRLMETVPGLQLSVGDLGLAAHRVGARLSSLDVLDADGNVVTDATFQLVGELFDFRVSGLSDVNPSAMVMIPLKTAIMPDSVYRKFINGQWQHFDAQNGDSIATAALINGKCPRLDDATAWVTGINASHVCLKLVIRDGGANDGDGVVNGAVADPGGLAVIRNKAEPQAPTESQTGSGHMAWWTLFAMMMLLMIRQRAIQWRSVRLNQRPTRRVRE